VGAEEGTSTDVFGAAPADRESTGRDVRAQKRKKQGAAERAGTKRPTAMKIPSARQETPSPRTQLHAYKLYTPSDRYFK